MSQNSLLSYSLLKDKFLAQLVSSCGFKLFAMKIAYALLSKIIDRNRIAINHFKVNSTLNIQFVHNITITVNIKFDEINTQINIPEI